MDYIAIFFLLYAIIKEKCGGILMSKRIIDLTGEKFGKLTVVELNGLDKYRTALWKCRCDCGNVVNAVHSNLVKGVTKSCGCMQKELASERFSKHHLRSSRIYNIYANMKQRCCNPNNPRYSNYGGRGITIYDGWLGKSGFENFYNWSIANGYSDELTIDRIKNEKGYYPDNCRWVTNEIQRNNQRKTVWIEISGYRKNLKQWTNFMGWEYGKYSARYRRGACIFNEDEMEQIKERLRKE